MQRNLCRQKLHEEIRIWASMKGVNIKEANKYFQFLVDSDNRDFAIDIVRILAWPEPSDEMEKLKEDLTDRDEANVISSYCFRNNTILDDLHHNPAADFCDGKMKALMVGTSGNINEWLKMRDFMKDNCPTVYNMICNSYKQVYTEHWESE